MEHQTAELSQLNALQQEKIADLQQTELALRESEERYTLAMRGSRDGLWDWNTLTDEVYFSPRFKEILGYLDDEIEHRFSEFESRLHPDDREQTLAAVQNHLERQVPYDVEYRLKTKQGDYRWIRARGQAIWNESGHPTRMAGSISDITDRKQVEDALRTSEARWQFALEGAGDGVWDWDAHTNTVFFSHQWKAMLGYADDEIGNGLDEWDSRVHPDDKEKCYADLNAHLNGNTPFYLNEHRMRCKDGSYKWILDRGKVIERDSEGKPLRVIGTHADMTDRKQAEEDLRQLNEVLEAKVSERTLELEQRARELERSNTELQQFAYVASHDLQEPLRTVSSFTELLSEEYRDRLDGEAIEYMDFIVDGAVRMQQLIADLLAYSRVGTRGHEFVPISCETVMKQVQMDLQQSINESHARIIYKDLPDVVADATQIQQVFQNLISNALKFHSQAPPCITISAVLKQNEWEFCVQDNGIGIEPDYFKQIFVIFQRLHTRRHYPGTGIGLAICRKIVQRHGGRIWVQSTLGEGSSFYFTLPCR